MSSHKREAKASFSVQTVGFPLIDYDAAKPISKETIDGAISWAMSNLEWVHEGMDGKREVQLHENQTDSANDHR